MALISFASLPTPDKMHDTGPRGVVRMVGCNWRATRKGSTLSGLRYGFACHNVIGQTLETFCL